MIIRLERIATRAALGTTVFLALFARPVVLPANAAGGKITVAQSADVLTLDPTANTSSLAINVYQNIFDQLTTIKADGSVGPRLAESWTVNDNATVWTFKLRSGAKFQDGSPVTADDVIGTYKYILGNAKSPVRGYLTTVSKVEKSDSNTVKITLKAPFITFARQVSLVSILPIAIYKKVGAAKFSTAPVGSGPFKVKKWVKDGYVELESYPGYWGGAPKVRTVIFRAMPSEASRAAALSSGEIDIVPLLPPPLVDSLARQDSVNIKKIDSNRTVFIGYDTKSKLLSNEKLRQAIDHSIDREAICNRLMRGLCKPVGQIAAPVLFGYDPSIKPTNYDPQLSKKLLAESGYDGTPITFEYPNNRWAFADEVAQAVAGYMSAVGIKVKLQPMEYAAFFPKWLGNDLHSMYMFSLGITVMDADLILNLEYESQSSHAAWSSPEVDKLAAEQRASTNPQTRRKLMSEVWKISQDKAIFSPLYNEIQAYGIRKCVDWQPRPDERLDFSEATSTCSGY